MQKKHFVTFNSKYDARYKITQRGSYLIKSVSQRATYRHANGPAQLNSAYISTDPDTIRLAQAFQPITNRLAPASVAKKTAVIFLSFVTWIEYVPYLVRSVKVVNGMREMMNKAQ